MLPDSSSNYGSLAQYQSGDCIFVEQGKINIQHGDSKAVSDFSSDQAEVQSLFGVIHKANQEMKEFIEEIREQEVIDDDLYCRLQELDDKVDETYKVLSGIMSRVSNPLGSTDEMEREDLLPLQTVLEETGHIHEELHEVVGIYEFNALPNQGEDGSSLLGNVNKIEQKQSIQEEFVEISGELDELYQGFVDDYHDVIGPQLTTEQFEEEAFDMSPKAQTLELAGRTLHQISPMEIQPGDVICTYESENTQPAIVLATLAQWFTASGRKENLRKMLHFEIVTSRGNHPGSFEVAHANGLSKQIDITHENFANYPPGTAIVVMRPRDERLKSEIIQVARDTAGKGNEWRIKGIDSAEGLVKANVKQVLVGKKKEKHLRKMSRMVVDSYDKFLKKDGGLKSMSCAQYASNVINSALLRLNPDVQAILTSDLSREEKIERIYQHLQEVDISEVYAAGGQFHDDVTSALLVDHILQHNDEWSVPGFVGYVGDGFVTVSKKLIVGDNPLNMAAMAELGLGTQSQVSTVFESLGLTCDNYIIGNPEERRVKLTTAFITLYAYQHGLDPQAVAYCVCDKTKGNLDNVPARISALIHDPKMREAYLSLETELETFLSEVERREALPPDQQSLEKKDRRDNYGWFNWSTPSKEQLNEVERFVIKHSEISIHNQTKLLSENTIGAKKIPVETAQKVSRYVMAVGFIGAAALLPFSAVAAAGGLAFGGGAVALNVAANRIEKALGEWKSKLRVKQEFGNNLRIPFECDAGMGSRPWLMYTQDGGNTWNIAPCEHSENNQWFVDLNITGDFEFKVFNGPWDKHADNPLEGASWQIVSPDDAHQYDREGIRNLMIKKSEIMDSPINDEGLYQVSPIKVVLES